jgi:hypothetical protein
VQKYLRDKLQKIADEVVEILAEKDDQYGSSWKSHGGFSAFFNLDRKYSRIENMSQEQKYDLFAAIHINPDGPDALKDLIGYALLTLSETYTPPGYIDPEEGETFPEPPDMDAIAAGIEVVEIDPNDKKEDDAGAGPDYVNQD